MLTDNEEVTKRTKKEVVRIIDAISPGCTYTFEDTNKSEIYQVRAAVQHVRFIHGYAKDYKNFRTKLKDGNLTIKRID